MKAKNVKTGTGKKHYTAPSLTTYGDIKQLTRTAAGDCRDNQNAFNNAEPGEGFTCS